MRLSGVQKALMRSIHDQGYPDSWWECFPVEKRTTDALERKGLLEYSCNPVTTHISFDVRLTGRGREICESFEHPA